MFEFFYCLLFSCLFIYFVNKSLWSFCNIKCNLLEVKRRFLDDIRFYFGIVIFNVENGLSYLGIVYKNNERVILLR